MALPNPSRLVVFDAESGSLITETPIDVPSADFADPPNHVARSFTTATNVFWFTGSSTIALALDDPHSTVDGRGHARRRHDARGPRGHSREARA